LRLPQYHSVLIGLGVLLWVFGAGTASQTPPASWQGTVRDAEGKPAAGAQVELRETESGHTNTTKTDETGSFRFAELPAGDYLVQLGWQGRTLKPQESLKIGPGDHLETSVQITAGGQLVIKPVVPGDSPKAGGGEKLSSRQVSGLPLNKRDFSQLLLLAAGTMTDTNGSANFTQQFAVNGQRGSTAMFAMDGVDTTDPELGGATFSNFNVDAVEEINHSQG